MLGSLDGFFFGGELRYFWRDVVADADRCGCGQRYSQCRVWRPVRDSLRHVDGERMVALDRRILLTRHLDRAGGDAPQAGEYRDGLARLYDEIRRATGARVVVDTSKAPSYALALGRLEDVQLSIIHLIRDPRATALSRHRDPRGTETGLAESALLWNAWNLLSERWFARGPRYARVRYEDFAQQPRETIARVLKAAGMADGDLPVSREGGAVLRENHSVAGNAARFRVGEVRVHPDERDDSLPRYHRAVVSALTFPLRGRYGYSVSGDSVTRGTEGLPWRTSKRKR